MILIFMLLVLWCLQSRSSFRGTCLEEPMMYTFNFRCPLFFSIGMILSRYGQTRFSRTGYLVSIPISICLLVCHKQCPASDASFRTMMEFLTIIYLAVSLWGVVPSWKWPNVLVKNSFPIFVLHGMMIYILPIPLKALGLWSNMLNHVGFIPIWVLAIISAIVVTLALRRFVPRVSAVLFGGR